MNDTINDCFVDIFGHRPALCEINRIAMSLPTAIIRLAGEWGWQDTEVRDMVYAYLEANKPEEGQKVEKI